MCYQLQYTNLQTEKVNHAGVISCGRWSKINQNADVNIGLDPNKTRHYKDSKVRADCRFPDITFKFTKSVTKKTSTESTQIQFLYISFFN